MGFVCWTRITASALLLTMIFVPGRVAQNIDINRCLVPTENWRDMLGMLAKLIKRFGNFAQFKNLMSLPDAAAAKFYHLRLIMAYTTMQRVIAR